MWIMNNLYLYPGSYDSPTILLLICALHSSRCTMPSQNSIATLWGRITYTHGKIGKNHRIDLQKDLQKDRL